MWELDYKESWALKNWCFWSVVLEKTLESNLDCKEILPVHPKGNQSLIFIGRTDAKAETPILWPPDSKNWLIWKDSDAGKDWRREQKGTTEDGMVGWHQQLNEHEFEQAPGVGDGQASLACCSPWNHKELDMTKQLNWKLNFSDCSLWLNGSGHLGCGLMFQQILCMATCNPFCFHRDISLLGNSQLTKVWTVQVLHILRRKNLFKYVQGLSWQSSG